MRAIRTARVAPGSSARQRIIRCTAVLTLSLLSACAYDRKLDKPIPLPQAGPIASAADERLSATIDAIIVRAGPGSWSTSPNWDEYLMHVRKSSPGHMAITRVVVVDSLGKRHRSNVITQKLGKASEETARRYKDANLHVSAGMGGALLGAGWALGTASGLSGLATMSSAAVAGALVAPVLVTAGAVLAIQEGEVQREMTRRGTRFPLQLTPEQTEQELPLDVFFPLAPAPQRVELKYVDASGEYVLVIDTREALAGLHLLPAEGSQPSGTPPSP